jgi:methylenetetrahydrofolate reductase (NADPH)
MKISKIIDKKKLLISFEIFPPKQEANFDSVMQTALDLGGLNPDFISVTYGAGGTTRSYTAELASSLQEKNTNSVFGTFNLRGLRIFGYSVYYSRA